ncbi:MAG: hypothetical protein ATN31_02555 [Candidatus Epulonipiscioides saccharophilum]|nr:MAG: hypothetical protein ATN31_02555 [Epulopiscium sp. AS2M-Bin001]
MIRLHEKFARSNIDEMDDLDLLAIILRARPEDKDLMSIFDILLKDPNGNNNLNSLKHWDYKKLKSLDGIGELRTVEIATLIELAKRIYRSKTRVYEFKNPEDVADFFIEDFENLHKETFYALYLDIKLGLIKKHCISMGTLTATIVHARDVFAPAIELCANSIIMVHNHPSGNPEPSEQDILVTRDLQFIGEMLRLPIIDHIIVGHDDFRSLRNMGLFDDKEKLFNN